MFLRLQSSRAVFFLLLKNIQAKQPGQESPAPKLPLELHSFVEFILRLMTIIIAKVRIEECLFFKYTRMVQRLLLFIQTRVRSNWQKLENKGSSELNLIKRKQSENSNTSQRWYGNLFH